MSPTTDGAGRAGPTLGPMLRSTMGTVASYVSPRHRRWRLLLESCDLDPEAMAAPMPAPGARDFIICGAPRSGTALATAALFQPPHVLTVMEPWDGLRLPPDELFASLRAEIATGTLRRGRLDVSALDRDGSVVWCRDGELAQPVTADPDHLLGVKWPSFWQYLDLLPTTRFVVCIRHPDEVIGSYETKGDRLGVGLEYDVAFNARTNRELLAATDDPAERRVLLYDYVYERTLPHLERPNVFALRYERWFEDRTALMGELGEFLGVRLDPDRVRVRAPIHVAGAGTRPATSSRVAAALGY